MCYGEVEEEGAKHRASYKGEEFFFCTASCRKKFEENPERYAKLATKFHIDPQMSC
jgi:YHS domain-containing protein